MRKRLALCVLALSCSPAFAQEVSIAWPAAADHAMSEINRNVLETSLGVGSGPQAQTQMRLGAGNARAAVTLPQIARLQFRPSAYRRQANYSQFVERSRRADPAGSVSLASTLSSDPVAQMGPELAKYGLRVDNLADAYTVYWVEAWQASHSLSEEGSRAQAQAVRAQAARALLATPKVASATDAQKQELADALLVQALLIGAAKNQAQGDTAKLRAVARAVRQGAKASGLDLDAMTLTEGGFVPAGKVGLRDDAPGQRSANVGSGLLVGAPLAGLGFGSLWLMKGQSSRGGG